MARFRRCYILFVLSFATLVAKADTLILTNGDRISGKIISQDSAVVRIESPILGQLTLPVAEVAQLIPDLPPPESAPAPSPAAKKAEAKKEQPAQKLAEAIEQSRIEMSVQQRLLTLPVVGSFLRIVENYNPLKAWKSKVTMGLSIVDGEKDTRSYSGQFVTERKSARREMRIETSYEYGTSETSAGLQELIRDRTRASFRYRENFSKRLFVQSNSSYLSNGVSEIDYDIRQSLGVGWRFIEGKRWSGTVTPSLTGQTQQVQDISEGWEVAPSIFEEVTYELNDHAKLRQESSFLLPEGDFSQASYMFLVRLETRLLKNVSFNVAYEYSLDGNLPPEVEDTQRSLTASFGLEF